MTLSQPKGHSTGMAGEFFVMERLFRLGCEPALTLGNAKTIDILVNTISKGVIKISVKSTRAGGKWPIGKENFAHEENLFFVFLLYNDFKNLESDPIVWIMPAPDVETRKKPWISGSAIYYSHKQYAVTDLNQFKNAWHYFEESN